MTLLPRIVSIGLAAVLIAAPGCRRAATTASNFRTVEFHIQNDDPTGLYVIEIGDEQAAAIEEDLQIDIIGHVCQIDRAFLRQSVQTFHHRGKRIGSGSDVANGKPVTALRVWNVRRTATEAWYYIGTEEQYVAIDRDRPHQIGNRVFVF